MMFHSAATVLLLIVSSVLAEELYSDKYDFIDVDEILGNPRLRNQYYMCFVGAGPCKTAAAKFFKEHFPEAIVTKCRKCTARQSVNFDKITDWYTTHEPDNYNAFVAKAIKDLTSRRSS